MSGVPDVRMEQWLNGGWVDLTGRVAAFDDWGEPCQISRGVGDSGEVAVGTLTAVLDNSDGALTPERPASPYYPTVTRFRPIRLRALIGGVWRGRFTGYVDGEELSWTDQAAAECFVSLSAIDAIGLASLMPLRSVAVEATAARGPIAYWPLTDQETTAAADQSGNSRPGLAPTQIGTAGEIGWTSGAVLPTDNGGGLTLTPASDTSGWYLRSESGVDLPASWSVSVLPAPAAKSGYVCQIGTDDYSIGIWYDTSSKKFSAIETLLDASGDPVDYVLSTSTSAWAAGLMETLVVTATTVKLGSSSTTGTRHNSDQMLGASIAVGGGFSVESGRARLYSGEVKHLAIWAGVVPAGLSADVRVGPAAMLTMSTAAATLLGWAGVPGVTVVTRGTDRPVVLVKTEGVTAADLLSSYAQGSMTRIFIDGDGQLVISAWDYYPTPVTAPLAEVEPEVVWGANPEGDVKQVTMAWPDGKTVTAVDPIGGSGSSDLPGVLDAASGASVAQWVASGRGGAGRLPQAPYDLLTLPSADVLALAEVGMPLVIPGLPPQLPSTSQSGVIDSYVETVGIATWTRQFVTSADDRDRMLIVGDASRGVVGSGRLAGPLGPLADGDSAAWRAGDAVTAAKLNSGAYPGGELQSGTVNVAAVANTPTSATVTFPSPFSSTPQVVVTPYATAVGLILGGYSVTAVTTTGFTVWLTRTTSVTTAIHWAAAN